MTCASPDQQQTVKLIDIASKLKPILSAMTAKAATNAKGPEYDETQYARLCKDMPRPMMWKSV